MAGYTVIDADGHVRESFDEIRKYLEPRFQRSALAYGDTWDWSLREKLGQRPAGPQDQLRAMDEDGVDMMVLYPTGMLNIGMVREREFSTDLCRAYNSWLHNFCQANPDRLKFVAVIAAQEVDGAAAEVRRAVTELGAVGAMLPTQLPMRPDWSHPMFDAIYAEAQTLDTALGFHASTAANSIGNSRFDNFLSVHTIDHPVEQMISLCSAVVGGVFERFPELRLAFLESGIGWVPYMMDRLDEEVEKRGAEDAPWLTAKPSEYITSGRCYFGAECGEKTIPDAIPATGDDCLLYASDYPHWDADWPHTVKTIRERQDLSEETKKKWLYDNPRRFYKLDA